MAEQPVPLAYQPLSAYLAGCSEHELALSFTAIEGILGRSLPQSAYTAAWWSNTTQNPQGRAWFSAGWRVKERRARARLVVFARRSGPEQ